MHDRTQANSTSSPRQHTSSRSYCRLDALFLYFCLGDGLIFLKDLIVFTPHKAIKQVSHSETLTLALFPSRLFFAHRHITLRLKIYSFLIDHDTLPGNALQSVDFLCLGKLYFFVFLVVARDFTCGLRHASQECYHPAAPLSSFFVTQDSV